MNIKIVWHNYYITIFSVCKYILQYVNSIFWKIFSLALEKQYLNKTPHSASARRSENST